jgi:hypothetical protein
MWRVSLALKIRPVMGGQSFSAISYRQITARSFAAHGNELR